MCGIWAWIYTTPNSILRSKVEEAVSHITARGPEGTRILDLNTGVLAFTRLAINGLNPDGMQPFVSGELTWMCNGEIYNAGLLEKNLGFVSKGSDCEVLGPLWKACKAGAGDAVSFCRALDGVFALVLQDGDKYIVARDPYGVRPLYYSDDKFRGIVFASERKALEGWIGSYSKIHEFPPGEVWTIGPKGVEERQVYHTVPWLKGVFTDVTGMELVRTSLTAAIRKRLMTERPIAALLSGGLDSSLIAACVQKMLVEANALPLKTFSIGMAGSSDLKYARMVADWIKSEHTEVIVTADQMFEAIPSVIRDIESYDITTVRASVGNWMVAREIRRQTDCKVVFNGDGSDEVWGSYLYFYKAPNNYQFEADSQRLLREICRYDVLRSDRSISSHGLEARTPFLDKQFVAAAMSLPTELRRPGGGFVEKHLMRRAFADAGLLPQEVLWRKKEAFSDGVSGVEKSWFQEIQERVSQLIPIDWEAKAAEYEDPKPKTPEAYYYRSIYESMYKKTGDYWPFWMPRWSPETNDPSARTLSL